MKLASFDGCIIIVARTSSIGKSCTFNVKSTTDISNVAIVYSNGIN